MAITTKQIHDNDEFFNVEFEVDGVKTEFTADKQNQVWEPAGDHLWSDLEETDTFKRMGEQFEPYISNMLSRATGLIPDAVE